jgi:FkbM family methyltransferase
MIYKFFNKIQKIGLIPTLQLTYNYLKSLYFFYYKKLSYFPEPYEFVELDVIKNLNNYIKKNSDQIKNIIIVGAHHAIELTELQKKYKNCNFLLFEASPRHIKILKNKFFNNPLVIIETKAVSNKNGITTFYETNLTNSGSILRTTELGLNSFGMLEEETYEVETITLNTHSIQNYYQNQFIDCLWIDVQGAELLVLEGATDILCNIKSIFIEVSVFEPLYRNGTLYSEIVSFLNLYNFTPFSLGLDYNNGTGNAFFINKNK